MSDSKDAKRPAMAAGCDPASSGWLQSSPKLGNQFDEDSVLRGILSRYVPSKELAEMTPDLSNFGDRVVYDLAKHHREMEARPPVLIQYDAWGNRVDELFLSKGWSYNKTVSAEEGLIAIGYARKHAEFSRLHQYAKLYLYSPASGLYSCPLAMTDGAARLLEVLNDKRMAAPYANLTSRDATKFWTSGQWMTERKGGSDVADGTETIAVPQPDGSYRLWGYKWFTSASDSDMTITLARIQDADGKLVEGTKGLSLFYVKLRKPDGSLDNIEVARLKNKLGTRQLPTAEMILKGTPAMLISPVGGGVKLIASTMINITRLHNATGACGHMRRVIALARDYTHRRTAFGRKLSLHPLHMSTLANLEVEYRAAMQLTFYTVFLMGKDENKKATADEQALLRLLTPVVKLYTGKQAVAVTSEGLECFGGAGYLEDTGIPSLLRDAQVFPIWEGTTNVLSMDVLRVMAHTKGKAFHVVVTAIRSRAQAVPATAPPALVAAAQAVLQGLATLVAFAKEHLASAATGGSDALQAVWSGAASSSDVWAADLWCTKMHPLINPTLAAETKDLPARVRAVALDLNVNGMPQGCGERTAAGKLRARM